MELLLLCLLCSWRALKELGLYYLGPAVSLKGNNKPLYSLSNPCFSKQIPDTERRTFWRGRISKNSLQNSLEKLLCFPYFIATYWEDSYSNRLGLWIGLFNILMHPGRLWLWLITMRNGILTALLNQIVVPAWKKCRRANRGEILVIAYNQMSLKKEKEGVLVKWRKALINHCILNLKTWAPNKGDDDETVLFPRNFYR